MFFRCTLIFCMAIASGQAYGQVTSASVAEKAGPLIEIYRHRGLRLDATGKFVLDHPCPTKYKLEIYQDGTVLYSAELPRVDHIDKPMPTAVPNSLHRWTISAETLRSLQGEFGKKDFLSISSAKSKAGTTIGIRDGGIDTLTFRQGTQTKRVSVCAADKSAADLTFDLMDLVEKKVDLVKWTGTKDCGRCFPGYQARP